MDQLILADGTPPEIPTEHMKTLKLCTERYSDFPVSYRYHPFPHIHIQSESMGRGFLIDMEMFEARNALTYIDDKIKKYKEKS